LGKKNLERSIRQLVKTSANTPEAKEQMKNIEGVSHEKKNEKSC